MTPPETDPESLLEQYVNHHLKWGVPPLISELCSEQPALEPELRTLVQRYHRLDSAFGTPLKDMTGRTLGSYRILKQEHRGFRSALYSALDASSGSRLILKVLPFHFEWGRRSLGALLRSLLSARRASASNRAPRAHRHDR